MEEDKTSSSNKQPKQTIMNKFFKAFSLGLAGAAAAIAVDFVAPNKSDAATCWFQRLDNPERLTPSYCQMNRRVNANGHVVWDIVDHKGTRSTLVFWDDNTVEIIGIAPQPIVGQTYTDREGDTRIEVPAADFEMAIRF